MTITLNGHRNEAVPTGVTGVTGVTAIGENGSDLLNDIEAFLARYLSYPSEDERIAHSLWVAASHGMEFWDTTPRLAFLSPEPGSGKTKALEVTALLVPRPYHVAIPTAAALFRKVGDPAGLPTLLLDEIDVIFGKPGNQEEIRGLINIGFQKGTVVPRCVPRGKDYAPTEFPAYCAVAMAGIGNLPDTILSRSVVIRMRRRAATEKVQSFRVREARGEANTLFNRLVAWSPQIGAEIEFWGWPEPPEGVNDRDADVWEALITVAEAAGGDWPQRARDAAVSLVAKSKERPASVGVQLLASLQEVFGDRDRMFTKDIVSALINLPEAPWAELDHGQPLSRRYMSKLLQGYDIRSRSVRVNGITDWGYKREDFADAWDRYLPELTGSSPSSSRDRVTSVTDVTDDHLVGKEASRDDLDEVEF